MLCGLLCSQKRKALAYTQFCSHWIPLSFLPMTASIQSLASQSEQICDAISPRVQKFSFLAEFHQAFLENNWWSKFCQMSASFPNLIVFGNLLKVHFGWSFKLLMSILNNNASAWTDGMLYPLLAAKSLGSLVLQLLFNASYSVFFQFIFPQSLSVSALATILEIILMSRRITYANLLSSI